MLSSYNKTKPIALKEALKLISSNPPEMKRFHLSQVIINPTEDGEMEPVSHIHDDDLFRLAEEFKSNKTLEAVVIDGPDSFLLWTEIGALAIGKSLKDHPTLRSLVIDLNTYKEEQIFGFLHCLDGTANITHLSIRLKCDSIEFLNKLGNLLLEKDCLQSIYISGSFLDNPAVVAEDKKPASLISFFNGIGTQTKLKFLSLHSLNFKGQDWKEIGDAMKEITFLKELELGCCNIFPGDIEPILSIAKSNEELVSLKLSDNPLREDGIKQLAEQLPRLKKLKSLDLSNTRLTVQALTYLVSSLREEEKIKDKVYLSSLKLALNPMDSKFIPEINRLIDKNDRLKSLDLSLCQVTEEHLELMRPILQGPDRCFLESLRFQELSPIATKPLSDIMYQNGTICLYSERAVIEHQVAHNMNQVKRQQKKWEAFIEIAICFGLARYSRKGASAAIS